MFRFCEGPNHWFVDGQTDTISEWKMRSARARLCLSFDRPSVLRRIERITAPIAVHIRAWHWGPWRAQVQRPAGPVVEDDVLTYWLRSSPVQFLPQKKDAQLIRQESSPVRVRSHKSTTQRSPVRAIPSWLPMAPDSITLLKKEKQKLSFGRAKLINQPHENRAGL